MKRRNFGRKGTVSAVGFGCMPRPHQGRRPKPSYEGLPVKRQVLVSVNSSYRAGHTPCQPRIRRDHAIPDHDPSIRERSSLRRVQSSHRRPDGPSGFCGDRQPSTSLGEREMRGLRRFDFKDRSLWNDAVHYVTPQGDEQLASQGDDHDFPDPPSSHCADACAEPHGQGAVRLPA